MAWERAGGAGHAISGRSSGPDISNAASASTSTFTTALVFNAIVFGAEIAAFTLVRPYFPAIYQPRTYVPVEAKRSAAFSDKLLYWPLALWRADYHVVKDVNGLDAYFFVRFLRMMAILLLPIWIVSWLVLLPVDAAGTTVSGRSGLDKLSFGNISTDKQSRYAAHLILTYFSTFWVWWNIRKEMRHFIIARQRWLIDPENATSAKASTVLIRGVPQRYLTEAALKQLFDGLPGGVAKVWLNRDLKEMPDLYTRRMKACNKLESAETSLLNTATKLRNKKSKAAAKAAKKNNSDSTSEPETRTSDSRPLTAPSIITEADPEMTVSLADELVPKKKRPTHRLPPFSWLPFSLPLIGKKVDSIEWARQEIVETSAELKECRHALAVDVAHSSNLPPAETNHPDGLKPNAGSQTYPPLNSAFILFNKQIAAHLATQALAHHAPYRMADRHLAVDPEDVIWGNLNMNPYEARIRVAISWAITAGLIILWAFPVAFVGAISNIHSLCTTYSWLAWICGLPKIIVGIISGILPPVLLAILMMMLPIVLRLLSRFEGTPTRTGLELSLMTRYFLFQVLHSFLIVTISSGIIATLPTLVKNPTSVPQLLAQHLPQASNFFLTYVILQGLSGTASGFLQVVPLALYYVKLFILGSTPRSVYSIKYTLRNVSWGTLFPSITLLVVIALAYSIISPVINGLACFTFFLFYELYKYLFMWQLDQPRSGDTGGLFFPQALQHVFVGLYIQQVCLAALFFLAQDQNKHPSAIPEGALMVVLIVFTAFFNIIINNSYGPLVQALPLSLADKTKGVLDDNRDAAERELHEADEGASIEDNYTGGTPSMKGNGLRQRNGSVMDDSVKDKDYAYGDSKGKAVSVSMGPRASLSTASDGSAEPEKYAGEKEKDLEVRAPDEEEGYKEFYHPASVEPQRVVWVPRDGLGLGEAEARAIGEMGIRVSMDDARMDEKGHVDISGPPPGGEVRVL
ncbi:hypothetical protein EIP86_001460 [Pleurotus ostreatoroseus]|nr:hypothetical protein EIP86_001460 [Pleurotus ostreatoroseus]